MIQAFNFPFVSNPHPIFFHFQVLIFPYFEGGSGQRIEEFTFYIFFFTSSITFCVLQIWSGVALLSALRTISKK